MKIQILTPALAVLSLRAKVRGRQPHIQALDWYVLRCIETGAFSDLTPEDFERARRVRRENNRMEREFGCERAAAKAKAKAKAGRHV